VKPPPFDYHAPVTVEEACGLLGLLEDAKVLAGGQSLVPLLNFRLARPQHLVDINRIPGLDRIYERDRGVAVQALARQAAVEDSELVARVCPLLTAAVRLVAHRVIRNRGTVCGSLAHADPASELPAVILALGGHVVARSARGDRVIAADEFFGGVMETALAPDELLVEAWFPASRGPHAIVEESRRHGDFALAGAALFYDPDDGGKARNAHVGVIGVADRPLRLAAVEAVLNGRVINDETIAAAAAAARAAVDPADDIHAGGAYRRALVGTMVERALTSAV